ncbi:MAG: dTMP kinase [Planctomycetota bacterium]|nr:dTMP kinase [Planctomycetota bacterium]
MSATDGARGRFLVLDGVDGCGKTTQAGLLVQSLERETGKKPLHLREPGSTVVGERIRGILLDPELELSASVETLLFAAARRQMLAELVTPALAEGRDVVCERFHPATFAYQAVAGGLDEERVLDLLETWAGDPVPDLVLVLDVDPATASSRREGSPDRIERKGLDFQRAVAEGFRRYAARVPNVRLVDAAGTPEEVAAQVREEVSRAG